MYGIAAGASAFAMTVKLNALAILATLVAFAHCVRSAEDTVDKVPHAGDCRAATPLAMTW